MALPEVQSGEALANAVLDPAPWPGALEVIRARHRLPRATGSRRATRGSFAVFFYGDDHVVKLVPHRWRMKMDAEQALLLAVDGRLPVATPHLVASGDLEGWAYLVMTRLPGVRLGDAWGSLAADGRARLVGRIGELMAAVHALPPPAGGALSVDWPRFVEEQRASAAERHAKTGADPPWVAEIDAYLDAVVPSLRHPARLVPMSADITDDHVLVSPRGGELVPSGFFDFGDALVGDPAYDFVTPVTFLVCGDPERMDALLSGYGTPAASRTPELRRRFMAYELLHRFSELRRDVDRLEATGKLANLVAIERAMWPF